MLMEATMPAAASGRHNRLLTGRAQTPRCKA
jgi:hypothetical protein